VATLTTDRQKADGKGRQREEKHPMIAALAITVALATASSTPAPPDGTYTYTIAKAGTVTGKTSVTVKRAGASIALHETGTNDVYSFVVDETLDAATLAPQTYIGTYMKGNASQVARVTFDSKGAVETRDGVSGSADLPLPPGDKNSYALEYVIMTGFLMLPAQLHASGATSFSQIMPAEVLEFPARTDPIPAGPRPTGVPAADVSLTVQSGVTFDIWYDPVTYIVHAVSVPTQNLLISLAK
jgi:hypothetical protein